MKQEIIVLIHLNTYVDYSDNKATDDDIKNLQEKYWQPLNKEYVDFVRQLNGFKVYDLNFYGTKRQDDLNVGDVWYNNYQQEGARPELEDYFIVADAYRIYYGYHLKEKKYCSFQFDDRGVSGGRVFDSLESLVEFAVKRHAKRFTEETKIIDKKALLFLASQVTSFLEARGFQKEGGSIILNETYYYKRTSAQSIEQLRLSFRINAERNKLSLTFIVFKRYNVIENFFEAEDMKKEIRRTNDNITVMLYKELPEYQSEFTEQELNDNYEEISNRIISFIEIHVFRAFSLYDDIRVLDANVNASVSSVGCLENGNVSWFHKMIIARLAGNPMYDEIFKSAKEKFEKSDKEFFSLTLSLNDQLTIIRK